MSQSPSGAQWAILHALRAASPEPLPLLTLARVVWPDAAPRNWRSTLFTHVYRLRARLAAEGASETVATVLRSDGSYAYWITAADAHAPEALRLVEHPRHPRLA